jgi:hemin uptake protein HemP
MNQPDGPATATTSSIAVVRTAQLFGSRREIVIEHRGQQYRLRITKTDKLILTK